MTLTLDDLAQRIQERPWVTSVFIVGIDGRSGSGKSHLAAQLARKMGGVVIHGDDFYRGADPGTWGPQRGYETDFDWWTARAMLTTLRNGNSTSFMPYAWTSEPPRQRFLHPDERYFFEGVYALRPELDHLMDFRICLNTPEDVRLGRLAKRTWDDPAQVRRWEAAEDWYFQQHDPRLKADAVIKDLL